MSKTNLTFTIDIALDKFDNSTIVLSDEHVENIRKTILAAIQNTANSGLLTSSDVDDGVPITAKIVGVIQN